MILVAQETSLVVAGAWNPAILTPPWVLQHALGAPPDQQVQIFVPAGAGGIFEFPRFVLEQFSFVVRPDALILAPSQQSVDNEAVLEDAAARMLEVLRHTPVTGIGHNFEFRETDPAPDHLNVFTASRQDIADYIADGWDASAVSLSTSFTKTAGPVVVSINRQFDAGAIAIKFNFHHPISSFEQAINVLRHAEPYSSMSQNMETARALMQQLYGDRA